MHKLLTFTLTLSATVFVATPGHTTPASKPCVALNTITVKTLPGSARYLQVSGKQNCSAGWEYNAVTVTDSNNNVVKFSTVIPANNGSYKHGEYYIPIPRNTNTLTVYAEGYNSNGLAGTATRTVKIPTLPATKTTLATPTVLTTKHGTFLQVAGDTEGYGSGALSFVTVTNVATGEKTVNGTSGVKTCNNKFRHGKVYFPVTSGETYRVTAVTTNNIPEETSDTIVYTVK